MRICISTHMHTHTDINSHADVLVYMYMYPCMYMCMYLHMAGYVSMCLSCIHTCRLFTEPCCSMVLLHRSWVHACSVLCHKLHVTAKGSVMMLWTTGN